MQSVLAGAPASRQADSTGVPQVGDQQGATSGFAVARRRVFPAIDGLRALAVLPVVVEHGGLHVDGQAGVTVFFVISGFLITRLLLDEHHRRATVDLRRFYYRRVARLLPALVAVAVVTVATLIALDVAWSTFAAGFVGSLTFTTDLLLASHLAQHVSTAFEWSWSLGTEEQFYLLWPALLLLSLRRWPRPRPLVAGLALLAVAVVVERPVLAAMHASHSRRFFTADVHLDALALGALVALVPLVWPQLTRLLARVSTPLALVAIGLLGIAAVRPAALAAMTAGDPGHLTWSVVAATGLVVAAAVGHDGAPAIRALSLRPLRYIGRLSYSLYLVNILVAFALGRLLATHASAGLSLATYLTLVFLVAAASHHFLEVPARTWINARYRPRLD